MATDRSGATASAIRDFVADKVAEKVAEKAAKHEQIAAKAAKQGQGVRPRRRAPERARPLDPARARRPPPALQRATRSRRPRYASPTPRDSPRCRCAASRPSSTPGTMTLYHYVRTKDELLTLVVDAVMGEVVIPANEPMPADWRAALTMIAERTRAALETPSRGSSTSPTIRPSGPNSVRHFDQSLQAVASLDLGLADKFDIVHRGRRVRVRLLPPPPQQPDVRGAVVRRRHGRLRQRPRRERRLPAARGDDPRVRARAGLATDRRAHARSRSASPAT